MRVYLIRHGESMDDTEDCYGGIADFPLNEKGKKLGEELALKLKDSRIQRLYTSPYKRAYETAEIIDKVLNCSIKMVENLREYNCYGVLSGVNKDKAKEIFAHILNDPKYKDAGYYSGIAYPGGEPRDEFDARVKDAFGQVIKDAEGLSVVGIITHGGVTRSIYRNILKVEGEIKLDHLALTVINYIPAVIEIESMEGVRIEK